MSKPESAETALRTQQIIGCETGIPDVADPLSGSHYVENLTDEIIKKTNDIINEIEELGGAVKAIENNFQQNMISKSAYDYQLEIDSKKRIVVGVNKFESNSKTSSKLQKIDKEAVDNQIKRLEKFKRDRNKEAVDKSLKSLTNAIDKNENLVPNIIECVESSATVGEISNILRSKFGEYKS